MTCNELRTYIDSRIPATEAEFSTDPGVASHVASCAACSQFMQQRQSLYKSLQLVRESVSPVSESLDAAVLGGYRRVMAERSTITPPVRNTYSSLVWRWSLVAALVTVATAAAVFSTRKPTNTTTPPVQLPSTTVAVVPQPQTPQPAIRSAKRMISPVRRHTGPADVHPARPAVAAIPDEFRGLMFCDELSCNGGMDMIRIQIPASLIARPASGFRPTSGAVNADVLIGPDGVARGIRVEN